MSSVDIVVYTNPTVLQHKKEACPRGGQYVCYWELGRFPKRLTEENLERLLKEYREREKKEEEREAEYSMGIYSESAKTPISKWNFMGRIYFAIAGAVVGSFDIDEIDEEGKTVSFYSDTWIPLDPIVRCKPFRGFRYRWW